MVIKLNNNINNFCRSFSFVRLIAHGPTVFTNTQISRRKFEMQFLALRSFLVVLRNGSYNSLKSTRSIAKLQFSSIEPTKNQSRPGLNIVHPLCYDWLFNTNLPIVPHEFFDDNIESEKEFLDLATSLNSAGLESLTVQKVRLFYIYFLFNCYL